MGALQSSNKGIKGENESRVPLVLETTRSSREFEKTYTFPEQNREVPSDLEDFPLEESEKMSLKRDVCKQNLSSEK